VECTPGEIRLARGFSQDALARAARISRGDVSRHERNHASSNPSLDVLLRLASALNVPATTLFECPGAPIPTVPATSHRDARVSYYVDGLLRHVESLGDRARLTFVQTMIKLLTMSVRTATCPAPQTMRSSQGVQPSPVSPHDEYE